jgi:hypothetical protein
MWWIGLMLGCTEMPILDTGLTAPIRQRVLVVGWDGGGGDAVTEGGTPGLDRLGSWGGLSTEATTELTGPTVRAPGWMSIMTGVDDEVTDLRIDWIEAGVVDVAFSHFEGLDHAGHAWGCAVGNPQDVQAVEDCDARRVRVLDAVEARTNEPLLVVATTDHGGVDTGHGAQDADNRTIFFAAGVSDGSSGVDLSEARQLDATPSVLNVAGLPHTDLDGLGRVGAES